LFGHATRIAAQTCVEGGLTTAGLPLRKRYIHAQATQNIDQRLAGLRAKRIHQAGDEQLNMRHAFSSA